jgi:hypothetical protein
LIDGKLVYEASQAVGQAAGKQAHLSSPNR